MARIGSPFVGSQEFIEGFNYIQAAELSDGARTSYLVMYVAAFSRKFPKQALSLAQQLQADGRESVLDVVARHSPRLAVDAIGSLQEERNRTSFSKIVEDWLQRSAHEVAEFVPSMKDGAKKRLLVEALVAHLEEVGADEEAREWKDYLETQ